MMDAMNPPSHRENPPSHRPNPPGHRPNPPSPRANLQAVVAATADGVIGRDGSMPWRLGGDLRRFKKLTMGGNLIMGRRTYDSIGRPLPGRTNVVLTRDAQWSARTIAAHPDVRIAHDLDEIASCCDLDQPRYLIGGGQLYHSLADRIGTWWITRVWSAVEGDTRIDIDLSGFELTARVRYPATPRDDVPTELQCWRRTV